MAGHVHGEEGEVVGDVGDAEAAIELQRVDRFDARSEQDVLGAQVAVALADEALGGAGRQLGPEADERHAAEASERGEPRGRSACGRERGQRLFDHRRQRRAAVGLAGRIGVKAGDRPTGGDEVGRARSSGLEPRAERRALVEAAHLDRVLDGAGIGLERDAQAAEPARHERHDAGVDARGKPPPEPQLLGAQRAPARRACRSPGTGSRTGFLTLYARSPARNTHEMWVSRNSTVGGWCG